VPAPRKLRSGADGCGLGRGDGFVFAVGLLLAGLWLSALADIDAALEECAVFDGDAGCDDVAGEGAVTADIDAVAGGEVAAHLAQDNDFAGIDVGSDDAVAADGDAVAREMMTRDLPMVAWSAVVVAVVGRGPAAGSLVAIGALGVGIVGRSGSVGRPGV
jgi:hypothetical protein